VTVPSRDVDLAEAPLLASSWTSAGDVAPRRGDGCSPLPLPKRIELVAAAGFTGMGIGHADLAHAREQIGLRRVAALLDATGMATVEVEFLRDWAATGPRRAASDRIRCDLLEAAAELGAATIKIGASGAEESTPHESVAAELDRLATEAIKTGARVSLEPMPADGLLPTVWDGLELVFASGNPNAGLAIDSYHVARAGTAYAELLERLPRASVVAVEIADGHREVTGTWFEDSSHARLFPGEGSLEVSGFAAFMGALGYRGPWGVEIISSTYRKWPVADVLERAYRTARQTLAAASAGTLATS
jgi:sugar phosphate isomerase/epimerase